MKQIIQLAVVISQRMMLLAPFSDLKAFSASLGHRLGTKLPCVRLLGRCAPASESLAGPSWGATSISPKGQLGWAFVLTSDSLRLSGPERLGVWDARLARALGRDRNLLHKFAEFFHNNAARRILSS